MGTQKCISCLDQTSGDQKMFAKVRTCTNPPPAGGKECEGEDIACSDSPCCPSGWSEFQGKCYKYFSEQMTWTDAREQCLSEEANLASIHSHLENTFVSELCNENLCWVGGM